MSWRDLNPLTWLDTPQRAWRFIAGVMCLALLVAIWDVWRRG